jgi:hypothetical protein
VLGKPLIPNGIDYPYGMNYKALPDNEQHDITPVVQSDRYTFDVQAQKHQLMLQHHCVVGGDTKRTDLGVGEWVTNSFNLALVLNSFWTNTWSTTAGSVSPSSGNWTLFTAPSNASPATVTATLRDEHVDVGFGVFEPSGYDRATHPTTPLCWYPPPPVVAAGMNINVVIAPTNVSFYRVTIYEVGEPASNLQGWYLSHPAPSHVDNGADRPIPLGCDNSWTDGAWGNGDWLAPGWTPGSGSGSFTWLVPVDWQVGNGAKHRITGWRQDFSLGADGTVTVQKFDHSAIRSPNQTCSTLQ